MTGRRGRPWLPGDRIQDGVVCLPDRMHGRKPLYRHCRRCGRALRETCFRQGCALHPLAPAGTPARLLRVSGSVRGNDCRTSHQEVVRTREARVVPERRSCGSVSPLSRSPETRQTIGFGFPNRLSRGRERPARSARRVRVAFQVTSTRAGADCCFGVASLRRREEASLFQPPPSPVARCAPASPASGRGERGNQRAQVWNVFRDGLYSSTR